MLPLQQPVQPGATVFGGRISRRPGLAARDLGVIATEQSDSVSSK